MSTIVMAPAVRSMARRLTTPFARGADTLALELQTVGNASQAPVLPYDFAHHQALFDRSPEPRYVLAAVRDVSVPTQVTVDYEVSLGGGPPIPGSAQTVVVPAGTTAGSSFALDLGLHEGADARLRRVRMLPAAPDGEAAHWWRLTAVLGNLSKLLWVMGWERDHVRRQLERTVAQRRLSEALGLSLDLLGYDLGVPRFPPLPYSIDDATVALYHLNDRAGATPHAEDIVGRYPGRVGHHGTISGTVEREAIGRFGNAFAFRGANAVVEVPDHVDFALPSGESFTLECLVKPQSGAPDGHALSKHPAPDSASPHAGWALSVGEFGRGLPRNVRFSIGDGAIANVVVFADYSLSTDRFHHLAGVVDRATREARLYIDGELRALHSFSGLQALTNGQPVRIGHNTAAFAGLVDEVRLSRAARSSFHPVLGESDQSYRQRLRLFERWTLPTPESMLTALNQAVGPINGDPHPLILNDANATLVGGTHAVTVYPTALLPGECMDDVGNRRVTEAQVSGTVAAEITFDPAYLLEHNNAAVIYAPPPARTLGPGELPPDPHRMQLVTESRLNRLLALTGLESAIGSLRVESAFDPRANDLRAVGRGLLLTHTTIGLARLAAIAHGAGFSFACHRADLGMVYASCAPGDYIEILAAGGTAIGSVDCVVGDTLGLSIRPELPIDALYRWLTITCGTGRATLATPSTGKSASVRITAPGELVIKVDTVRHRRTASATRLLRIGVSDVANNASVGGSAGVPDPFFHVAFLIRHDDSRATYGANPNNRLMQASVAERLTALLNLIQATGAAGALTVRRAFVPGAADLTGVGRGLTLRHASLPPGRLAALAHAAGFTLASHQGADVVISQAQAELADVSGPQVVDEAATVHLVASVKASDLGLRVRLTWALAPGGQAGGRLSSTTATEVDLRGERAGQVRVRATYSMGDNPDPYTFEVRLKPSLEAANAVIRKEQYDLIMNILNVFHPVGVEVGTRAIRERVIEIGTELIDVFPDHTYPKFRVRGPAPRRRKE